MDIFCPANQAEEVYIRGTRRFIPIFFPLMSSIKEQRGFVAGFTSHGKEKERKTEKSAGTLTRMGLERRQVS